MNLLLCFGDLMEGENTPLRAKLLLHKYSTIFIIMLLFYEAGIA
jgi:hypothetical protein